ncbi:putative bifunctional diguanylate cyclase/phosphodiesterase [Desulfurivibrio alkaliphilus]|uniref:Response regulator receiver modulated diguanylate cyclase/phosphodiesterase n=1 Tax=Desulfurivibrio alkaliphilus (strain DSM 19089 / UNIQEM U267 / AHT2) TaxID=589865 RepID=D6Z6T9_DESAT|nr:EAL domain-containing protein [Desulfurivibrio alkaliphilus]ADH85048.1 response regulator receiver modulated diguanylate cyclase/phosphodiesterase [Desulfurivibrio alkaliphilus AHT 2]
MAFDQLCAMEICVVDEDPVRAQRLSALLRDEGDFTAVSWLDSQEALRQRFSPASPFDPPRPLHLALLSDSLPADNVLSLCKMLDEQGVTSVLMADAGGAWRGAEANRVFDAGAVDILFRPWSETEVIPRIFLALRLHQERLVRRRREVHLEKELAERRVMEARLKHRVGHDELTGLPNRSQLEGALELALIRAQNFQRSGALLYLDVDHFKLLNDTEGHESGDKLLTGVAGVLRRRVLPRHLAVRIGGDEFAVLLENTTTEDVLKLAEELRELLHEYRFEGCLGCYNLGASIGVALMSPGESLQAGELLSRADQACHVAKRRGRNRVHCYDPEDPEVVGLKRDATWVPMLRQALRNGSFALEFQPIVRARDGACCHYEALIRLLENGKMYSPGEFIPSAERMGLIHQLDLWVVEAAVDRLAAMPLTEGQEPIRLSINLSAYALRNPVLMPLLERKLEMTGLSPRRLMFEITETTAVTQLKQARELVERMRSLGCRFALDDFGSGFSTFNYLKHFPVDMLKIDGSFVVNMLKNPTDELLVRSMVELAHSLDKQVIAEFVEDEATARRLREIGVDYLQGFYLGRPQSRMESLLPPSFLGAARAGS